MSLFNTLIPSLSRQPSTCSGSSRQDSSAPTIKPRYDLQETDEAWGLTVYLPGVNKDGLELTVDQGQLRVFGHKAWKAPEGWTTLYQESSSDDFELLIDHDNAIDSEKIHAELKEGVLLVSLPKAAEIKPRKVSIN